MWTSFKDYQHKLKGKGYTKGFIPCNLRASNEFRNKTAIAYPVNRYISPVFIRFLRTKALRSVKTVLLSVKCFSLSGEAQSEITKKLTSISHPQG